MSTTPPNEPHNSRPGSATLLQRIHSFEEVPVEIAPGLIFAALATVGAVAVNAAVPQVSTLIVAVLLGMAVGNASAAVAPLRPGLAFVAKKFLRAGVVLLGMRLSIGQVTELGWPTLLLVIGTVTATFFGTQAIGRRLGLSRGLSLLVATGYSICGASAIAAMEGQSEAEEEEVAVAIGLVTLAGSLAMFLLPILSQLFGLSDAQFGTWVGASVHDVAQVVAAASTGGAAVLSVAVVVKLTRVVLLAPIVAGVSIHRGRERMALGNDDDKVTDRPPLLPGFVLGFLALMVLRTTGIVPAPAIDLAKTIEGILLTIALVGLGAGVRFGRLRKLGGQPLVLGFVAWFLVAAVSLVGTSLLVA